MKKFFNEFKVFITRGNVVDMAVGVIVGSSFTAIVNALSNNILKPVINWLIVLMLGENTLSESFTFLKKVCDDAGAVDLTQSIYIDWGLFINAIINFLIVAFVLFCIVKAMNSIKDTQTQMIGKLLSGKISKEDKKALKAQGISLKDTAAVEAYFAEKAKAEEAAKAEEEAKAKAEAQANPTVEMLLKDIRELLKNK